MRNWIEPLCSVRQCCVWTAISVLAVTMVGCRSPLEPLDEAGPSMRSLLRDRAGHRLQPEVAAAAVRYRRAVPAAAEQRSATAELQPVGQYLTLHNPLLLMWVHPHWAGGPGGVPVPGYMTAFPLYRHHHMALPQEPRQ